MIHGASPMAEPPRARRVGILDREELTMLTRRSATAVTDPPMPAPDAGAAVDRVLDPFAVGAYLTDGSSLLGVVGELPQEPTLRLLENCRTLEITVVSVNDLHAMGMAPVAR